MYAGCMPSAPTTICVAHINAEAFNNENKVHCSPEHACKNSWKHSNLLRAQRMPSFTRVCYSLTQKQRWCSMDAPSSFSGQAAAALAKLRTLQMFLRFPILLFVFFPLRSPLELAAQFQIESKPLCLSLSALPAKQ